MQYLHPPSHFVPVHTTVFRDFKYVSALLIMFDLDSGNMFIYKQTRRVASHGFQVFVECLDLFYDVA
jgi:hypothetical protein